MLPLRHWEHSTKVFQGFAEADRARAAVKTLGVDVKALESELLRVSVQSGNLASQTELLAAAYDVASAGFGDAAENAQVLEASLKGAVGGMSDLGTVSDATTSVLNAYGLSADNAARLVDGFIQTQNDGKIVVDQYAKQIGRLAPIAATAGVGIDELNAAISTITAQGVPVEATFTGLRQAIAAILKPTKEASDLAAELGIEFNTAALKSKGLGGVLEDVIEKSGGSEEAITQLFGSVEALGAILPLVNDKLGKYNKNLDNQREKSGQAADATEELGGTVSQQITRILNGIGNLTRALDTVLGPALKRILTDINNIISRATEALRLLSAVNTGAATFELAKGATALTFGFESDGIDALTQSLQNLNPSIATSEQELKDMTNLVERVNKQLQRIGPNSANLDKVMAAQRRITSLRNQIGGRAGQLQRAEEAGVKPPTTPTPPPTISPSGEATSSAEAEKAAAAAARQLQTAQDLQFAEQNRLALAQQMSELDRIGLEGLIKKLEIERQFDQLLAKAVTAEEILALQLAEKAALKANELTVEQKIADLRENAISGINEEIALLEARLNGTEEIYQREKDIVDLVKKGGGTVSREEAESKVDLRNQLKELNKIKAKYEEIAKSFADSVASGLKDVLVTAIQGGDIQQAFSDLFAGLGDTLLNLAFEQIAEMLAETISNALTKGIDTAAQAAVASQQTAAAGVMQAAAVEQITAATEMIVAANEMMAAALIMAAAAAIPGKAEGGPVVGSKPYIVGERGPELFVPSQSGTIVPNDYMASAMQKYTPGSEGGVASEGLAGGSYGNAAMADAPISISTGPVMQFQGENYVTQEEFAQGVQSAAKQGEARALRKMQMSSSTRKRVGI